MPDLRELLGNEGGDSKLPTNHRSNFETKLQALHPKQKKKNYTFLMIAASVVVLIGLAFTFWPETTGINAVESQDQYDLANVSPELKEIETNYITAINLEMLGLKIDPTNKELIDKYLKKVAELEKQYKQLSKELITNENEDETVNALINNLQVRLQLLVELKDNLKELEQNKKLDHEEISA